MDSLAIHPNGHGLSHALLEDGTESAVAPEAALVSQMLGGERTLVVNSFMVEVDEVVDTRNRDRKGPTIHDPRRRHQKMPPPNGASATVA